MVRRVNLSVVYKITSNFLDYPERPFTVAALCAIAVMSTIGVMAAIKDLPASPYSKRSSQQESWAKSSPTTSASPTPATSATPVVAAPAPTNSNAQAGKHFGISVGNRLPSLSNSELGRRLDDFKALGVTWIRLDLDWNDIQPSGPGSYSWSRFDAIVDAARARGLTL